MTSFIGSLFKGSRIASSAYHLVREQEKTKIANIVVDTTLKHNFFFKSTVTDHPTANGESISDHIFNHQMELKLEGFFTDSSLKIFGILDTPLQNNSIRAASKSIKDMLPFSDSEKPTEKAFKALKSLHESKSLITVVHDKQVFNDMAIRSIKLDRSSETSGKLDFTIELRQMKMAKVEVTDINVNKKISKLTAKPLDAGNVQLKKVEMDKSFFASALDFGSNAKKSIRGMF